MWSSSRPAGSAGLAVGPMSSTSPSATVQAQKCDPATCREARVATQVACLDPIVRGGDPRGAVLGVPHVQDVRELWAAVSPDRGEHPLAAFGDDFQEALIDRHRLLAVGVGGHRGALSGGGGWRAFA